MFMIVLMHSLIIAAYPQVWEHTNNEVEVHVIRLITGFLYIAVNCYILISGYFCINFKIRNIVNIWLLCGFYAVLGYCIHLSVDHALIGKSLLTHSIFCLSNSKLWYIKCYIALMFMSPFINIGIQNLNKQDYKKILLLFTILNVYFGYLWGKPPFNADGYTMSQFVYLYLIGGYIRKHITQGWLVKMRKRNLMIYVISAILWGALSISSCQIPIPFWNEWAYNNPCTLIGSITFFFIFISFHFQSRWINKIATGTLAVYVIHCGDYWNTWILRYIHNFGQMIKENSSFPIEIFGYIILSCIIVFMGYYIDVIRKFIMRPIWQLYDYIENKVSKGKILSSF